MLEHSLASWKRSGNLLLFLDIPLGVIRILGQTRPLLLVLEHAGGSWLASAEDSYHGSTGFLASNYINAWSMLQVQGISIEEIVFEVPDASGSPYWTLWPPLGRHIVHMHRVRCLSDFSKSCKSMFKRAQEACSQCQFRLQCEVRLLFLQWWIVIHIRHPSGSRTGWHQIRKVAIRKVGWCGIIPGHWNSSFLMSSASDHCAVTLAMGDGRYTRLVNTDGTTATSLRIPQNP